MTDLIINDGHTCTLTSPTALPRASGFLWNRKMMLHMNARGFATSQFMQPEPAKYAYAPNLEAKTFMQPEQPYYAHHPGRFFYLKDEETGEIFSAPYEPVRVVPDKFAFTLSTHDITWQIEHLGVRVDITLNLPVDDVVELWEVTVTNLTNRMRTIGFYPFFTIGYMSWMNQSATFDAGLNGIIATCVTPYQKVADYFKNKDFKDKTFFLSEHAPSAWECRREAFEGEGGLHNPDALREELACEDAIYETPTAVMTFDLALEAGASATHRFLFGPAFDEAEIATIKSRYLSAEGFATARRDYQAYIAAGAGVVKIKTPDAHFDQFVNHWLARQVYYHGDVNRLTTDPQTRNYLQDALGMVYIRPDAARIALITALSQQHDTGAMPDGVLLVEGAELKYINQVPHTDHCVWLPILLDAYVRETGDYALLDQVVTNAVTGLSLTVRDRMTAAMNWLLKERDHRGLSYIAQGDWCDPMNMVGYKGKGVSGWLTLASGYALRLWAQICADAGDRTTAATMRAGVDNLNTAANTHLWDGQWYARGITDDDVVFGVASDPEGRIYLNPQTWSFLSGAATPENQSLMMRAVTEQLETPYGVEMLGPPYSAMRDDVGRVTQKWMGSAENGAVYNHAAIFYIYSLFQIGQADKGFELLRKMVTGPDESDYLQRGQMPVFIPNYYRGAYRQHPRTAGRSSQLFNTGTVAWVYHSLIDGLLGLSGTKDGLRLNPQLPAHWDEVTVTRLFRGATFEVIIRRGEAKGVVCDGAALEVPVITGITSGHTYQILVTL
ncbi:GH36-type glycosyl hydrolase domain-containing protein [Asticcacaulis machinosus]|uniref:Glycosyltransferase 36 n=1 Tax=Asticcacaulis machinosus TaxID=2984211 RepID=A0ABT5HHQ1_9CAUL|nr:glycosyl hydrolase family 65 protein [Asticcacaulis machinosus]MDC7675656.1 glycosyltransferase 36 [Asticcacaulis machinosus]